MALLTAEQAYRRFAPGIQQVILCRVADLAGRGHLLGELKESDILDSVSDDPDHPILREAIRQEWHRLGVKEASAFLDQMPDNIRMYVILLCAKAIHAPVRLADQQAHLQRLLLNRMSLKGEVTQELRDRVAYARRFISPYLSTGLDVLVCERVETAMELVLNAQSSLDIFRRSPYQEGIIYTPFADVRALGAVRTLIPDPSLITEEAVRTCWDAAVEEAKYVLRT